GGRPPGYACCTFRGSVAALDAETGTLVWKSYTIRDAPALLRAFADGSELRWAQQMAPSTPDVFGCTPGAVNCGERAGPDFDFGASPVLATLSSGRQLVVAGQKSGVVFALDPDNKGRQVWRYRAGGGSGLG